MDNMKYLFILMAYLSGSVPYGLILSRVFGGVDVRKIGSGNIGATNVLRTGKKGVAVATLFCDFCKGFAPVYGAKLAGIEENFLLVVAYAAILGHIFPVWLKFRGGKGVATSFGVFWGISSLLGCGASLAWPVVFKMTGISSLCSLCTFALSPLFAVFFLSWPIAFFCLATILLLSWTHRTNIQRLLAGNEEKIQNSESI
jgi:glycerol-3-phosphate acyltransferase PlsY